MKTETQKNHSNLLENKMKLLILLLIIFISSHLNAQKIFNSIERGAYNQLKTYVNIGGDLTIKNKFGKSLVNYAISHNKYDIATFLIANNAPLAVDDLIDASSGNQIHLVEQILEKGIPINGINKDSITAIVAAAKRNNTEISNLLLAKGANVAAILHCQTAFVDIAQHNKDITIVKKFIDAGVDINVKSKMDSKNPEVYDYGFTPLMKASEGGNIEIVNLLLDNNADVNVKTNWNKTAWMIALKNKQYEVFYKLIDKGAEVPQAKASLISHNDNSSSLGGVSVEEIDGILTPLGVTKSIGQLVSWSGFQNYVFTLSPGHHKLKLSYYSETFKGNVMNKTTAKGEELLLDVYLEQGSVYTLEDKVENKTWSCSVKMIWPKATANGNSGNNEVLQLTAIQPKDNVDISMYKPKGVFKIYNDDNVQLTMSQKSGQSNWTVTYYIELVNRSNRPIIRYQKLNTLIGLNKCSGKQTRNVMVNILKDGIAEIIIAPGGHLVAIFGDKKDVDSQNFIFQPFADGSVDVGVNASEHFTAPNGNKYSAGKYKFYNKDFIIDK